jgi:hypothetical protein
MLVAPGVPNGTPGDGPDRRPAGGAGTLLQESRGVILRELSDFIQTGVMDGPHPPAMQRRRGVMYDAQRYHGSAAECLRAAYRESQPYSRALRISMAASWLSLAHQDDAMDELQAHNDTAEPGQREVRAAA